MAGNLKDSSQDVATQSDADIYVYAGAINVGAERDFYRCISNNKASDSSILILTTLGGSADAAYQMVRCLKRRYDAGSFTLYVPSVCKSAGTLIALGADAIVMSDTAELGPLDIQISKPEELGELMSGLTPSQALDTLQRTAFQTFEDYFLKLRFRGGGQISTRMAADVAASLTIGLFSSIYGQFDPMRLGENIRSTLIAVAYGDRIKTKNVKDETIERLVSGYPSHGFAIDRDEAKELFNEVREPDVKELTLLEIVRNRCYRVATEGEDPIIEFLASPVAKVKPESPRKAKRK